MKFNLRPARLLLIIVPILFAFAFFIHPSGVQASPAAILPLSDQGDAAEEAVAADTPNPIDEAVVEEPSTTVDSIDSVQDSTGGLPSLLRLPTIGVEMEVEPVGVTEDGSMAAPTDPAKAGWYSYGARPGDNGNAAIGGHVDWDGIVRPFWYLRRLQAGDPVEVVSSDGERFEFTVQWLDWYDIDSAPVDEIFANSESPELTLITCGGTFDVASHQYLSRLVVRAAASGQ